jgi:hypothetical protein
MQTITLESPIVIASAQLGTVEIVRWIEGQTYEDTLGRTYYSGAAEPSSEDAEDCLATPRSLPAPVGPRKQSSRTVLSRLTDTEYSALHGSTNIGIQRGLETARIEALISESDPDFPAFCAGCDALGIIAFSRWDDLLAP